MDLTFFGLTSDDVPQVRANLFTQIHEIVFHGQGGYDYDTVYNMPIWLRKFTFKKIEEYYSKSSKNNDIAEQAQQIKDGKIDIPSHFKGKLDKTKRIAKY